MSSNIRSLAVAAVLAVGTPLLADSVVLTAPGGPIADRVGTTAGTTFFDYADNDSPSVVQSIESVTLNGFSHSYAGDLIVELVFFPDDLAADPIEAILFENVNDGDFTGPFVYENNFGGNYSFSNAAAATLQESIPTNDTNATVPAGTYLPSEFYFGGDDALVVDLSATFAGVNLSEGTFSLFFNDVGIGDTGSLGGATLNLTTAVPEPTSIAALALAATALVRRRA